MSIWKIVESKYITDLTGFQKHPYIRNSFLMPRNLVVYEFWDDVYEVCFSPDPDVRKLAGTDAAIRQRLRNAVKIEQSLISGLYNYLSLFAFSVGAQAFQYVCAKGDNFSSKVKLFNEAQCEQDRLNIQLDGVKRPERICIAISEWNSWASKFGSPIQVEVDCRDGETMRIHVGNIEKDEYIPASMLVEFGRMAKAKAFKRILVSELDRSPNAYL